MVARSGVGVAPVPGNPPVGTAPTDHRLVLGAQFGTTALCLSGGTFTPSGANMQFVGVDSVYQVPDSAKAGAVYHCPIDAKTLTPAVGPGSGSRIDSIYVLQNDYEKGAADSRVDFYLQAGVAAGSPGVPSIPAQAIRVANILVPTNATLATQCTLTWFVPPAAIAEPPLLVGSKTLLDLIPGQFVNQRATVGSIEYRWNGTLWQAWESDWLTYSPTVTGLSGTLNGSPGWVFATVGYRYTSGKVRLRVGWYLNGGSAAATGQQTLSLPVNAAAPGVSRMQAPGQVQGFDAAPTPAEYKLVWTVGATTLYIGVPAGTNGATAPTNVSAPFTWAQSDQVDVLIEYDPA